MMCVRLCYEVVLCVIVLHVRLCCVSIVRECVALNHGEKAAKHVDGMWSNQKRKGTTLHSTKRF